MITRNTSFVEFRLQPLVFRRQETVFDGWLSKSYGKMTIFLSINAQIITRAYKVQI